MTHFNYKIVNNQIERILENLRYLRVIVLTEIQKQFHHDVVEYHHQWIVLHQFRLNHKAKIDYSNCYFG